MAQVTINIVKAEIFSIVEGISVTISQHNSGTPTHEQLWASEDEARKLAIWYREAISDLERRLMRWVLESSGQFDLTADGEDYTLTLKLSRYWPQMLQGLLKNKVQDYLVHSVTAGWLNDFDGLTVKQDYQAMAAQDLGDLVDVICMQRFDFAEASRQGEDAGKDAADIEATSRQGEDAGKDAADIEATSRQGEDAGKDAADIEATSRQGEDEKSILRTRPEAGYRRKDCVRKSGLDDRPILARERTIRHKDNAFVDVRGNYTDMSGTDMSYQIDDPMGIRYRRDSNFTIPRPMMGMGYTPRPQHPPIPTLPPTPSQYYDGLPVHAVPPRHVPPPPFYADGEEWSDKTCYDIETEERFINSNNLLSLDDSQ